LPSSFLISFFGEQNVSISPQGHVLFIFPCSCDVVFMPIMVGTMHPLVPLHHFLCEGSWSDRVGAMKFKAHILESTPSLNDQDYEP
jgi:hypothetical protein